MGKKIVRRKIVMQINKKLKRAWDNEPVEFIGGIRLNHKKRKRRVSC